MLTFFAFILVFGMLVFVHELGHFLVARRIGVRVEEFAFGFPPRIWGKKKGETLYSINLIPLGGFVRMYGEHGEGENDKASYTSKTKWQKIGVLISGVIMNFLLAVVLFTFLYAIGFESNFPGMEKHTGVKNDQKIEIVEVEEKTPAAETLKQGDIITRVEDRDVFIAQEIFVSINELTKDDPEKVLRIGIVRDGKPEEKLIKTYETEIDTNGGKTKVRRLGIKLETQGKISAPFYLAPLVGFAESFRLVKMTLAGIVSFFGGIITKFAISKDVVGPVVIASMVGSAAEAGITQLMLFTAFLSISLAVINIMPIPALDGGHMLILIVEKIKGKDLSHDAKNLVQFIGFILLIALMLAITFRDIAGVSVLEYVRRVF